MNTDKNPVVIGDLHWHRKMEDIAKKRREEVDKKLVSELTVGQLRLIIQEELREARRRTLT